MNTTSANGWRQIVAVLGLVLLAPLAPAEAQNLGARPTEILAAGDAEKCYHCTDYTEPGGGEKTHWFSTACPGGGGFGCRACEGVDNLIDDCGEHCGCHADSGPGLCDTHGGCGGGGGTLAIAEVNALFNRFAAGEISDQRIYDRVRDVMLLPYLLYSSTTGSLQVLDCTGSVVASRRIPVALQSYFRVVHTKQSA